MNGNTLLKLMIGMARVEYQWTEALIKDMLNVGIDVDGVASE